ncbi:hypothetical protein CHUAL_001614 [Chamberlinius hualienensis]
MEGEMDREFFNVDDELIATELGGLSPESNKSSFGFCHYDAEAQNFDFSSADLYSDVSEKEVTMKNYYEDLFLENSKYASKKIGDIKPQQNGGKRKLAAASRIVISNNNSEDDDEGHSVHQNKSKNAIAARENRLKKKRYVADLEKAVESLKSEKSKLESKTSDLEEENSRLLNEVNYLRNVLANSDQIAVLIDSIKSANTTFNRQKKTGNSSLIHHDYTKRAETETTKMSTRSSNKRKFEEASENQENDYKKLKTAESSKPSLGGVCIHVNNGKLALECCASCSANAYNKGCK